MVHIKVCGPGCMNCEKLAAMCRDVIMENEIEGFVEKITDRNMITDLGIFLTPGLIINNKIVNNGKIPTQSTLYHWIIDAANENES